MLTELPMPLRLAAAAVALALIANLFYLGAKPWAVGLFPPPWDKLVHLAFFGSIAGLAWIGFGGRGAGAHVGALAIAAGIGLLDEVAQLRGAQRQRQGLPGRLCWCGTCGAAVGGAADKACPCEVNHPARSPDDDMAKTSRVAAMALIDPVTLQSSHLGPHSDRSSPPRRVWGQASRSTVSSADCQSDIVSPQSASSLSTDNCEFAGRRAGSGYALVGIGSIFGRLPNRSDSRCAGRVKSFSSRVSAKPCQLVRPAHDAWYTPRRGR